MPDIYEVELSREQSATVYVEASSPDEARSDAEELVSDEDWLTDIEETNGVTRVTNTPRRYWSGGEDGAWVEGG